MYVPRKGAPEGSAESDTKTDLAFSFLLQDVTSKRKEKKEPGYISIMPEFTSCDVSLQHTMDKLANRKYK